MTICAFSSKQKGNIPVLQLKIESTQGVGDVVTETDMGFTDLISDKTA